MRTHGCSACHGTDGQGGVGPALTGLYGSQVTLADGSTAVADEAYLAESIRTPGATKTAGYDIDMPANDLDDDQIAAVIAYIRALAGATGES
jgi:cytochrome c oxidase subunit 2